MNLIWCPSIDVEMQNNMASVMHSFPNMHQTALEGGHRQLGAFNPQSDKLYILAHGHAQMPIFRCNHQSWTANQLVKLLRNDDLPTDWRDIELLVCHAGESVNSAQVGNKLLGVHKQAVTLKAFGFAAGSGPMNKLVTKYNTVAANGQAPSAFDSGDQLLPLAAQFTQALKDYKFTNFRVISYAAPVAQNFMVGRVTLDMRTKGGGWEEELAVHPDLIKIWQ